MNNSKPLGRKNYGSIGHLPGSRRGPGDRGVHPGQARICVEKARDRFDEIIVQEKLDGSNVGVALIDRKIIALGRAGYPASTSPYEQHQVFAKWVWLQEERFRAVLHEGERLVGEWLLQAHGTRYHLLHEPFVAFDLMVEDHRMPYEQFRERLEPGLFVTPYLISRGFPIAVDHALNLLGEFGKHGAIDPVEGIVYRVEREKRNRKTGETTRVVDFLAKYVRPDKVDGCYLPEISGLEPVWNWRPVDV